VPSITACSTAVNVQRTRYCSRYCRQTCFCTLDCTALWRDSFSVPLRAAYVLSSLSAALMWRYQLQNHLVNLPGFSLEEKDTLEGILLANSDPTAWFRHMATERERMVRVLRTLLPAVGGTSLCSITKLGISILVSAHACLTSHVHYFRRPECLLSLLHTLTAYRNTYSIQASSSSVTWYPR